MMQMLLRVNAESRGQVAGVNSGYTILILFAFNVTYQAS